MFAQISETNFAVNGNLSGTSDITVVSPRKITRSAFEIWLIFMFLLTKFFTAMQHNKAALLSTFFIKKKPEKQ